jgi:glucose/arabinose dehydrogenase
LSIKVGEVSEVKRVELGHIRGGILLVAVATALIASSASVAEDKMIDTKEGTLKVDTVAEGLEFPWGFAFLPDGRMLVTERPGRLRIVGKDGTPSEPLDGVPKVFAEGQGGLLDVALDPKFAENGLVYLSYSEPGEGDTSGTAVARGKLGADGIENVEVIFRQKPKVDDDLHYGSRLAFSPDGKLFVTLGERFKFDPAQDLSTTLGKVVRMNPDGSVPDDNPFVGQDGKLPEIYSYGHRNPQGVAIHPETGKLWENEFGPLGGDELNIIEPGKNYGWPVVSWGKHYNGKAIPEPTTHPEFADAIKHWTPVISPSGMTFYTGNAIPAWKGNLLISGLSSQGIVRLTLDGDKVTGEERIELGKRIRNVVQGPDGAAYALTDQKKGKILRLTLSSPRS